MLTLTDNASSIVKSIASQSVGTEDAGLRISEDENVDGQLTVDAVESPQSGDEVVESDGAKVFLEEAASVALSDKVLDARVDEEGSVQFSIGVQD